MMQLAGKIAIVTGAGAGMGKAIASAPAPVIAVSPFVAGEVVKGPTEELMRPVGQNPSASGLATAYAGLIDGLIADADDPEPPRDGIRSLLIPTLMSDATSRRALAERALEFARSLR